MKRLLLLGVLVVAGCADSPRTAHSPLPDHKAALIPPPLAKPHLAEAVPQAKPENGEVAVVFGSDGCWTQTTRAYKYLANLKAGDKVTMEFRGAYNDGTEADPSVWDPREGMLMPLDGNGTVALATDMQTLDDGREAVGHTGAYLFTFAPESSQGWMGSAKICRS